jgi:hypothetical protein
MTSFKLFPHFSTDIKNLYNFSSFLFLQPFPFRYFSDASNLSLELFLLITLEYEINHYFDEESKM